MMATTWDRSALRKTGMREVSWGHTTSAVGKERTEGERERVSAAAGFIMEITPFALLILRPPSSTTRQTPPLSVAQ